MFLPTVLGMLLALAIWWEAAGSFSATLSLPRHSPKAPVSNNSLSNTAYLPDMVHVVLFPNPTLPQTCLC